MGTFWKQFFWGPPSHKRIAWIGGVAGLVVILLPVVIAAFGAGGHPVFLASLFFIGLAEVGWGIELLPRRTAAAVGWGRAMRWLSAIVGLALTIMALIGQLAPLWFLGPMLVGCALLVLEMAPNGPANRA
jgi:hypothetical protein